WGRRLACHQGVSPSIQPTQARRPVRQARRLPHYPNSYGLSFGCMRIAGFNENGARLAVHNGDTARIDKPSAPASDQALHAALGINPDDRTLVSLRALWVNGVRIAHHNLTTLSQRNPNRPGQISTFRNDRLSTRPRINVNHPANAEIAVRSGDICHI